MSDTYYYYDCTNSACGRDVSVDVRVKDEGKVSIALNCPICAQSMEFCGRAPADEDGYPVRVKPDTMQEMIEVVWLRLGEMQNPWTSAAMSSTSPAAVKLAGDWYNLQIELGQLMFSVINEGGTATEKLLRRGLDFLAGRSST